MRTNLLVAAVTALSLASCSLFAGTNTGADRSRPVVRVETRNGIEYGAATSQGVLFLNQWKSEGPCRVTFFLGPYPVTDDGLVKPFGGGYHLADIDLKHAAVPLLSRDVQPDDKLVLQVMNGTDVESIEVTQVTSDKVQGGLLVWPGRDVPAGSPVFRRDPESLALQFVGLAVGEATLGKSGGDRLLVFTGPERLREALANPSPMFKPRTVKYREGGLTIER